MINWKPERWLDKIMKNSGAEKTNSTNYKRSNYEWQKPLWTTDESNLVWLWLKNTIEHNLTTNRHLRQPKKTLTAPNRGAMLLDRKMLRWRSLQIRMEVNRRRMKAPSQRHEQQSRFCGNAPRNRRADMEPGLDVEQTCLQWQRFCHLWLVLSWIPLYSSSVYFMVYVFVRHS